MTTLAIFFRTRSYGGMEGNDLITENFTTEQIARTNAISNTWNEEYKLYKVEIIAHDNGKIETKETKIADIPCGKTAWRLERCKKDVEYYNNAIIEVQNNKRIGDKKKVEEIERCQFWLKTAKMKIQKYEKMLEELEK